MYNCILKYIHIILKHVTYILWRHSSNMQTEACNNSVSRCDTPQQQQQKINIRLTEPQQQKINIRLPQQDTQQLKLFNGNTQFSEVCCFVIISMLPVLKHFLLIHSDVDFFQLFKNRLLTSCIWSIFYWFKEKFTILLLQISLILIYFKQKVFQF